MTKKNLTLTKWDLEIENIIFNEMLAQISICGRAKMAISSKKKSEK